jgi:hypothetical protein
LGDRAPLAAESHVRDRIVIDLQLDTYLIPAAGIALFVDNIGVLKMPEVLGVLIVLNDKI